jgi:uncharacterized membrane protein
MDPKERNRREWERPENWHGPRLISFYAAENDTRVFVSRRSPSFGMTLNLAHPVARAILILVLTVVLIGVVVAVAEGRA